MNDKLHEIIKSFPDEFGISLFPDHRYRISEAGSWISDTDVVGLCVQVRCDNKGEEWATFAPFADPEVLRKHIVYLH